MPDFKFFHPIEVRYGDLDPQGHVNNAKFLTYMEQTRLAHVAKLGLWTGGSFLDLGVIVAEARITYLAPIHFGQRIHVGLRTSHMGNKSFHMEYSFRDADTGQEHATASTVQVAYDYHTDQTIPVPDDWREALLAFEAE